jgi:hypothetical protein
MVGLFAGVPGGTDPGDPSSLRRALKRLHDVRLIEELVEHRVRLHPLVREFAKALTPETETPAFRHNCVRRVLQAFEDFASLERICRANGVDGLEQTLMTALDFNLGGDNKSTEALTAVLRVFRRESHCLREWTPEQQLNFLSQQVLFRATTLGEATLAARAKRRLEELAQPALVARWRTLRESHTLVRILAGHRGWVSSVAVSPDSRHVVSGSDDETVAIWDLRTGQRLRELVGHRRRVNSVAVSPDGRYVVSGSDDETAAVWDLQSGAR